MKCEICNEETKGIDDYCLKCYRAIARCFKYECPVAFKNGVKDLGMQYKIKKSMRVSVTDDLDCLSVECSLCKVIKITHNQPSNDLCDSCNIKIIRYLREYDVDSYNESFKFVFYKTFDKNMVKCDDK